MLETLKILLAAYLLLLAGACLVGQQRAVLAWAARGAYSITQILAFLLTAGRYRLEAPARRQARGARRSLRQLRYAHQDWLRRRQEEREIRAGRAPAAESLWQSDPTLDAAVAELQQEPEVPLSPVADERPQAGEGLKPLPKW